MNNDKKDKLLTCFYIFCPPLLHTLFYFLSKLIQGIPHNITTNLDKKLPFISWFIVFYCIWYLLLIVAPLIILKYDKSKLKRYAITYIVCSIISTIIYVIFPTTFDRPNILSNGIFEFMVKWIYSNDIPAINCFPSFHALLCFLWIICIGLNKKINKIIRLIVSFICVGILLSTMLIKQHSYIDLIGAFIIVTLVYFIIYDIDKKKI